MRVAAAKIPVAGGYALSFAIVNDSDTSRTITVAVPSVLGPLTLARYDYFDRDRPADANGFPVPAEVLDDAQLASGITIQLPSRGLVVLTSLGYGAPVALDDGTNTLLDDLGDWSKIYGRSKRLKLDHSDPARFDDDRSRATSTAKGVQYLVYRASQMTSFEIKAYYKHTLGLVAYRSLDGRTWTPIKLVSTNPAPSLGGGGWYLAELAPSAALPAGTNELKIELTNEHTELSQVVIHDERAGPACTAQDLQGSPSSLGGVPLGVSTDAVSGRLGMPSMHSAAVWRYCVEGGGEIVVVFGGRSGVSLVVSTASSYRPAGIGPGSSVASLRRRFLHAGLQTVDHRIFIARLQQGPVLFVSHAGAVEAVAIATPAVISRNRSLSHAIRLAGLG